MKKNLLGRMGALTLALSLVTTCLLSGTLAKYTTTVSGTGTATVAKWSFKANGQDATMAAVDLASTVTSANVKTGTIAPGTDGSFAIEVDATGSETALDYEIKFGAVTNQPANLKFYSDAGFVNEINLATTPITGDIALADVATKVIETVYWKWVDGAGDTADQGKAMSFTITVTGTQAAVN